MYRAGKARGDVSDEIPLAHRINTIGRVGSRAFKTLGLFSLFLSILFVFLFSNYLSSERKFTQFVRSEDKESIDGRLLGHLPYSEANKEDLRDVYPGLKMHKDVIKPLFKMQMAAAKDGVEMVFLSGFRSIELQNEIFYKNKSIRNQIAIERAKVSAPPGYSEHSTGYAIDIGDKYMRKTDFEIEFAQTPTFIWLERNAAKYHFILSFPKGNSQGVSYEPWHWRYEGSVDALRQFDVANKKRLKNSLK